MGIIRWLKNIACRQGGGPSLAAVRPELPYELKLTRLLRAIREFPGRTEADLARIIYGRLEALLIREDVRALAAAGLVAQDAETGRLHAV